MTRVIVSFRTARAAVRFVYTVLSTWDEDEATLGCGREGAAAGRDARWWIRADVPGPAAAPIVELAWACGGAVETAAPHAEPVSPAQLALQALIRADVPAPATAVHVITGGEVSHRVLRRCVETGARAEYQAVVTTALDGSDPRPGIRVRVSARGRALPVRVLGALEAFPETRVFRPCDSDERLLLGLWHRLPIPEYWVAGELPGGDTWCAHHDSLRVVRPSTPFHDAADLFAPDPPIPPIPQDPPSFGPNATSVPRYAPIPVRVVSDLRAPLRQSAVLLTDDDLDDLRVHLRYRQIAAEGLLLLGAGQHLLVEPGGLMDRMPIGRPMWRAGRAPVFVETGYSLHPPVPPGAHRRVFGLQHGHAVALWPGGAAAFDVVNAVPLWAAWLLAAPELDLAPSTKASAWLADLERLGALDQGALTVPGDPGRGYLDHEPGAAARLDLEGRFAEAARLLEEAGDWERAAAVRAAHAEAEEFDDGG
ncbi:MAG: hypothetical protein HOW97_31805 [Catenulispora sp.]|nr:hypothetical protein [Catenulispora sp.]